MSEEELAVINAAHVLRINFPADREWTKDQIALADALRNLNLSTIRRAPVQPAQPAEAKEPFYCCKDQDNPCHPINGYCSRGRPDQPEGGEGGR